MHWTDGSYSDHQTREEALEAVGPGASQRSPVRLEHQNTILLEGDALASALRTRKVAFDLYEAIRLDDRQRELDLGIINLYWDGDDAHFVFSGHGQLYTKSVTREALLTRLQDDLANAVIRELRMEIGFRRGEWGQRQE